MSPNDLALFFAGMAVCASLWALYLFFKVMRQLDVQEAVEALPDLEAEE